MNTLLRSVCAAATLVAAAVVARAQSTSVTNYNWLQLPPGAIQVSTGTEAGGTAGVGYGNPQDFRWGHHVWIPNVYAADGTNYGTRDYYAVLRLDQPRRIESVWAQWWANESTSISRFYVDGSSDGTAWSQIGSHNYGSPQTGSLFRTNVDVTDGDWQYVRIRVEAGDYTHRDPALGTNRGGPGLYAIEPIGSGSVANDQVNWANRGNFGTTVSNLFGIGGDASWTSNRFNDGLLYDDGGQRSGDQGTWEIGEFAQVNLNAVRPINGAVVVWENGWGAPAYKIQYSTDGVSFNYVTGLSAAAQYDIHDGRAATGYTFYTVNAQFFRIVEASGNTYNILNQVMLYTPEPGTALLAGLGALALLRRRRPRPQPVGG